MEINCPNCSLENAYFNGTTNICPDCDYTWINDYFIKNKSSDDYIEEKYYNSFVKVDKGVKYSCNYGHFNDIKEMIIVPLAKDSELFTQYILLEADKIEKQFPDLFNKVISMNFSTLESNIKKDIFKEIKNNILYVRTGRLNTFLDYYDSNRQFHQFNKIN